jgi:hypothetical protein
MWGDGSNLVKAFIFHTFTWAYFGEWELRVWQASCDQSSQLWAVFMAVA